LACHLIKPTAAISTLIEVLIDARRGHGLSLAIESGRQSFAGHLAIHTSIVAQHRQNVPVGGDVSAMSDSGQ
jgi:hypothetical protein